MMQNETPLLHIKTIDGCDLIGKNFTSSLQEYFWMSSQQDGENLINGFLLRKSFAITISLK